MKKGRCAFLNKDNLCDIYINLGKESLCEICSLHPRYRNFLKSHTELGYGLCCEVVANKIINYKGKAKEVIAKKGISFKAHGFEKEIINKRKEILFMIQNRRYTFIQRLDKIMDYCKLDKRKVFSFDFKKLFLKLEVLDGDWKTLLNKAESKLYYNDLIERYSTSFEQLFVYFIHRHLVNAKDFLDFNTRIAFAILSVILIGDIFYKNGYYFIGNLEDISRAYSSEVEYDNENFFAILSVLEDMLKR